MPSVRLDECKARKERSRFSFAGFNSFCLFFWFCRLGIIEIRIWHGRNLKLDLYWKWMDLCNSAVYPHCLIYQSMVQALQIILFQRFQQPYRDTVIWKAKKPVHLLSAETWQGRREKKMTRSRGLQWLEWVCYKPNSQTLILPSQARLHVPLFNWLLLSR